MKIKLEKIKDIIKSVSITCLLIILTSITTSISLSIYYFLKLSNGKAAYNLHVSKYPYVIKEYEKYNFNKKEIIKLLSETWLRKGWEYESRTVFREIRREGEYVNVSKLGFRRNRINTPADSFLINYEENKKIPLVYFFGGSTTFGYGVSDKDTIPANLEVISKGELKVINFGRGYYYSQQENDLLYNLIKLGSPIPEYAIFLDGLNERCWGTSYEEELKKVFKNVSNNGFKWEPNEYAKPFLFIFSKISSKLNSKNQNNWNSLNTKCKTKTKISSREIDLNEAFLKALYQREDLCKRYEIECITFLQPLPGHLNIHKNNRIDNVKEKIDELNKIINNSDFRVESLVDSLSKYNSHAFIDNVHYSPKANNIIATKIYQKLKEIFKDS